MQLFGVCHCPLLAQSWTWVPDVQRVVPGEHAPQMFEKQP
jgi:hypothetical protein